MRAESGVNKVTAATPISTATASGGSMKSQAETPAARAATSSWLRDSRTKVKTPPSRMAKGIIFWPRSGNCSTAMPMITGGADVVAGGAIEQIHEIDGKGQGQKSGINHRNAQEKLQRQIAV